MNHGWNRFAVKRVRFGQLAGETLIRSCARARRIMPRNASFLLRT